MQEISNVIWALSTKVVCQLPNDCRWNHEGGRAALLLLAPLPQVIGAIFREDDHEVRWGNCPWWKWMSDDGANYQWMANCQLCARVQVRVLLKSEGGRMDTVVDPRLSQKTWAILIAVATTATAITTTITTGKEATVKVNNHEEEEPHTLVELRCIALWYGGFRRLKSMHSVFFAANGSPLLLLNACCEA